jgi:DNA-binding MarR family transcriptional regulator
MSEAPHHPYRVTRAFEGTPLTDSQRRVLTALVAICPDNGCDVDARKVAKAAGLRLGSVVVILQSLEKKRLVLLHESEDDEPDGWAPTMNGRSRVRHFPSGLGREPAEDPVLGDPTE